MNTDEMKQGILQLHFMFKKVCSGHCLICHKSHPDTDSTLDLLPKIIAPSPPGINCRCRRAGRSVRVTVRALLWEMGRSGP
jgi:hypothetical protein